MAPAKPPEKDKIDELQCKDRGYELKNPIKEDDVPSMYTRCFQDFGMKTATGFIIGSMIGSFFLRGNLARWPKFICGGLGFGMAYSNCENSLNDYLIALSPKPCPVKKKP